MQVCTRPQRHHPYSYNSQDPVVKQPSFRPVDTVESGLATALVELDRAIEPRQGPHIYAPDDPRFQAANALANVDRAVDLFCESYGRPIEWATGRPKLLVTPRAGEGFKAYYDRDEGGVFFFQGQDPVLQKVVHPSDSGEVVVHETGHALLDAVRPLYFDGIYPDGRAFHESFGDILSLVSSLQDPEVRATLWEQTQGDLRQPNSAAAWAEQIGITLRHQLGKDVTGGDYVRNAINSFVWQDPATLPQNPPHTELGRQEHNFSRLWTGANYDLLGELVQAKLSEGLAWDAAVAGSADELMKIYGRLLRHAPEGQFTYRDMARCLVASDGLENQGRHREKMEKVFLARQILQPEDVGAPFAPPRGVWTLPLRLGPEYGELEGAVVKLPISGARPDDISAVESEMQAVFAQEFRPQQLTWFEAREGSQFVAQWEGSQLVLKRPARAQGCC